MLTFVHTWAFWLLPLPLLVRWLLPPGKQSTPAVRVPFIQRLQEAGGNVADQAPRVTKSLVVPSIVWLLLLTALARPQWLEAPIERITPTRDLLLVVDLSGSMDHQDFTNAAGTTVNRLDAVKEVLSEFLVDRKGDRVGLVVFGNAPFLQIPFTTDLALCQQLLQEMSVGMAGPRTALGDAIGLGIKLFEESDAPQKTMITLTDGNDTASQVPPVEASRIARDHEITIHSVAIGDPTTVGEEQLDKESMEQVAKLTGGGFYLALNRDELTGIYEQLDEIETREVKTVSHRPRRDLFYWPVAVALLISIVSEAIHLLRQRHFAKLERTSVRIRVNSKTFELQPVES